VRRVCVRLHGGCGATMAVFRAGAERELLEETLGAGGTMELLRGEAGAGLIAGEVGCGGDHVGGEIGAR